MLVQSGCLTNCLEIGKMLISLCDLTMDLWSISCACLQYTLYTVFPLCHSLLPYTCTPYILIAPTILGVQPIFLVIVQVIKVYTGFIESMYVSEMKANSNVMLLLTVTVIFIKYLTNKFLNCQPPLCLIIFLNLENRNFFLTEGECSLVSLNNGFAIQFVVVFNNNILCCLGWQDSIIHSMLLW